ncbi:MAG: phospho-N-acetylmuramoyl-pentapeptide-transferase [Gudongella sp.]|jgi:phospho-N-acetylmuramoyl-pentapeptide-transferase|nr:phospho-N-acetylmuramoyl-pentapeptide-transferase [Gudongella sp.]
MNYTATVILSALISLSLSILLGPRVIPVLRNLKIGQTVREDGPRSHMSKSGTPTMGGVIFGTSFLITVLLFGKFTADVAIIVISSFLFGTIGFLDDYIKVVKKRNLGLRAWQKITGQLIAASVIIFYIMEITGTWQSFYIPILGAVNIDFKLLTVPFFLTVILGTVNAVNLTDGLDGLATGISIIVFTAFGILAVKIGRFDILPVCISLVGALTGFLLFNYKPARVFMGDTGSLALGGALASVAVISGLSFYIPLIGGVFFAETLSVIIQVVWFKLTGKRFFRMAPLHHHFEQKGVTELRVVWRFWLASLVLAVIGVLLF